MPDAHAEWLARNTFACPRLGTEAMGPARITPAQCEHNRSRPDRPEMTAGETIWARKKACSQCIEDGMWQVFQAGDIPAQPVAKKQPKTKAKKGKAMPKGHKKCPNCGSDVLSTNMACWHCGYDFKAKSMPAQNEPENATSGDDVTCYDGGAMKSAQVETKNPGQDALNKIGEKGGRAWKTGFRTLQINMPEDDPLFRKIEETADQFGVKPGKVAEWLLRGLPFELVEPEQAEA